MRFAKEYRVVDVEVVAGGAVQSLLLKEHSDRLSSESKGRTLFFGNVDFGREFSSEQVESFIKDFFAGFGEVESVSLSHFKERSSVTRNTRFAHVVFSKKRTLKAILEAPDEEYRLIASRINDVWGIKIRNDDIGAGELLEKFKLRDVDPSVLKDEVDSIMAAFEAGEQAAIKERERKLQEVDDDGFMLVKHRNKRKRTEATSRRSSGGPRPRKKKSYELKNFYSHQKREEKREKLLELRQKFEEDKQKVAKMKEARKFKPF